MAFNKLKKIAGQPLNGSPATLSGEDGVTGSYYLSRLAPLENWPAVQQMFRNYPGVDTNFEQISRGRLRPFFLKYLGMPLYFWLANEGWALWSNNGQMAGQLFLQHRRMVTHINDIEVNREFQGRGLSHKLLALAEREARQRHKQFLTLAVTLTNTRAAGLYRRSGFLEQHHHYYYLTRPRWSEPAAPAGTGRAGEIRLVGLKFRAANRNLQHFFDLETRTGEALTAPVWQALYRPRLPRPGQGYSYAVYLDRQAQPRGHVDFFDWNGRGRWRIYTEPDLWGTPQERGLYEALVQQARTFNQLGLMTGTLLHHVANRPFAGELGLTERDTERMLMIKPLN